MATPPPSENKPPPVVLRAGQTTLDDFYAGTKNVAGPSGLHPHHLHHRHRQKTTLRRFRCELCAKMFDSKFKLERHKLIHSARRPFKCGACDMRFNRKDHLSNHVKIHTRTKKTYRCAVDACAKEYISLGALRVHRAHHELDAGNSTCTLCGRQFAGAADLRQHLKIHTGSRTLVSLHDRKIVCETCQRRFCTQKDLKRHLVVHTKQRNFLCQFCPHRFGRKDHLDRHIRSHARQQELSSRIEGPVTSGGDAQEPLLITFQSGIGDEDRLPLPGFQQTFQQGMPPPPPQ